MYQYKKEDNKFVFYQNKEILKTPSGNEVSTIYEKIAEQLLSELKEYRNKLGNAMSLIAFHYSMIDFFARRPIDELRYNIAIGLEYNADWTFHCPTAEPQAYMNWNSIFGTYDSVAEKANEWLLTLTRMKLCAVCCVGTALESVNIPYILATSAIKWKKGDFKYFIKCVNQWYPYISVNDLKKIIENFLLYYQIEDENIKKRNASNIQELY